MSSEAKHRRPWGMLLAGIGALLIAAFAALGLVQVRHLDTLSVGSRSPDSRLESSLLQFELEYLKLRLALEQAVGPSIAVDPDQVAQRYEAFVRRANLIDAEHTAQALQNHPDYQHTLARTQAFIEWADALPLDAQLVRNQTERLHEALDRMEGLAESIHELSLLATQHDLQQTAERNELLRQQSRLSVLLAVLLFVLTLGLVLIALRQFRSLTRFGRAQETLAESLQEARRDAEAGSRSKSVFLANMSHELRTPMHGLLGMLGLLKDTPLSRTQQSQLKAANDSAHHLLAVLNDILDVSKMEAGGITIHLEPVQLSRLLRELEELTWPQAKQKGLDLNIRADGDIPSWVSADPTRLRQILLNLLSNAIKFSERGRVSLWLSRQTDALGQQLIRFEVSDTGIGMDAATLAKLFQRFSQGDASSSRRFGGTGLGLEISRNLARAMGGDIHVSSEAGKGSMFTLELRLPECEPPAHRTDADIDADPAGRMALREPLRILVSEDHDTNRAFLEAVIERLGHQAVFCENGFEALQALKQTDFDLVLMDLHTPLMDGYEATRAIRALPAPKNGVKIIALSADAYEESRERAIAAGMDDFLAKPVGVEALANLLGQASAAIAPPVPRQVTVQGLGAPDSDPPELDNAILLGLQRNLPAATVQHLYRTYLAGLDAQRQTLAAALQGRDSRALHETAHSIKGAAANLGLLLVSGPALDLERVARLAADGDVTGAVDWQQMQQQTEHLLQALSRSATLCAELGLSA